MFPGEKSVLTPYKGPLERGEIFDPDIEIYSLSSSVPPVEHTSLNPDRIDDNVEVIGVVEVDEKIADVLDRHQVLENKEDVGYPALKGTVGLRSPCIPASSFPLELLLFHPRIGSENNHPLRKKL